MMHWRFTVVLLGLKALLLPGLKALAVLGLVAGCLVSAVDAEEPATPAAVSADHAEQMAASTELFKAHVRDILSRQCLHCHGGEETHGEFDLSTREGLLKGGALGPAAVAGKPEESILLAVLRHEREPHMPQDADKLPDDDIQRIADWIAAGAAYDKPLVDAAENLIEKQVRPEDRQFWSFQPLATVDVPAVGDRNWCRTPIDQFLWTKLAANGIEPNGIADKRRLIRRAYLDLLGIPPAPQEVARFLADSADDAYDRLIDELLASPHYGERWGRHWLDLARFAESHGYEQDYDRPTAYHYRDFVIRALNEDMPYDQFVRWQVAGDEIAPDTNMALMATGFLGAGTHATQITANQVEKERYDELDDMAATVGTAFLGLTIGCARCHDHKYDPIPQGDYYRLLSTFTTTVRTDVELDFKPEQTRAKRESHQREHEPLVAALAAYERDELPGKLAAWLASDVKTVAPTWLILDAASTKSDGGAEFQKLADQSLLVKGNNADADVYTITANVGPGKVTAVRLEALAEDSLPKRGPGRAANGNFALSDFQLWAAPEGTPAPGAPVKLVNPKVTYEQEGLPVAATLDDNKQSAWAVDGQIGKNQAASFALETPIASDKGTTLTFVLKFENNKQHNLGRLRLSTSGVTDRDEKTPADEASQADVEAVNSALAIPVAERNADQQSVLAAWHRQHDAEWQTLSRAVFEHAAKEPQPELMKVMICSEGLPAIRFHTQGGDYFDETFYLKRGDLNQKLGVAEQGFLQVLMLTPESMDRWREPRPDGARTSFRRTALANWLTDNQAGAGNLLARVIVNRLWQHHFGRGIVATPSDFGASGERPTHPELLDYLATDLVRGGWRLKRLHKQMMTSAAYMQTSETNGERAAIDPDNTLLWHRTRQRLEAEAIRDSMLAVSGLLNRAMYGPGSLDESHKRRSIYFTIKRSQLIPSMMLFDGPDSLQGLGQRATTIVAPQALSMLNNPQVLVYSAAFADRLRGASPATLEERVSLGYESALARPADEVERRDSSGFIRAATENYKSAGVADPERQALADFCQVLFGLNEFIYID
jgi:cytochrome c553